MGVSDYDWSASVLACTLSETATGTVALQSACILSKIATGTVALQSACTLSKIATGTVALQSACILSKIATGTVALQSACTHFPKPQPGRLRGLLNLPAASQIGRAHV